MNLVLNINENDTKPLYVQLYEGIKKEITDGRLKAGTKMPSIRKLSKTLNMSKTTIENTYHQLIIEGYIYSVEKKGYYVKKINHTWLHPVNKKKQKDFYEEKIDIKYDLTNSYIEEKVFDKNAWRRSIDSIIYNNSNDLLRQGDVQGELSLRKEIVNYLYQSRGGIAHQNQVIVGAGIQPLLQLLSSILKKSGRKKIGFEDPGFNRAKNVFLDSQMDFAPIKIQKEGINIDELKLFNVDVCYISPSHQFPTGTVMPINKRSDIIHWAQSFDGYIIEDDYNSELRYHGRPIPSLQGLNKGERVIYLGSFSTVFLPSIRISYMILPESLLKVYKGTKELYAQTASKLEQLAMAKFIKEGYFEKHIRRIKVHYAKKQEAVNKILKKIFGDKIYINDGDTGFNLYLEIKTHKDEQFIKKLCKEKSILVNVLSDYTMDKKITNYPVLILSYKGILLDELKDALEEIKKICF
ncbi:MAG: PLP-dependent aminotransferase family protein [bacterium]